MHEQVEAVGGTVSRPWAKVEGDHLRARGAVWVLVSTHPGVLSVREHAQHLYLNGEKNGALALIDRLADGYTPDLEQAHRATSTTVRHGQIPTVRARTIARPRERRARRSRRSASSSGDSSGLDSDSDSDPPVGGALTAARRRWVA